MNEPKLGITAAPILIVNLGFYIDKFLSTLDFKRWLVIDTSSNELSLSTLRTKIGILPENKVQLKIQESLMNFGFLSSK